MVDGATVGAFSTMKSTATMPLAIGAINNYLTKYPIASQTIFPVEIIENGETVRHYIPCISPTGTVGLYDIVNGVFQGNNGTGTFIAGTEIPSAIDGHNIPIKEYGMWTVTATNGEKTATQDVLVDAAIEFAIPMSLAA